MATSRGSTSSTFLPFIVDSTPPTKVYSTLVTKNEGVNFLTILQIFFCIEKKGVDEVRNEFKACGNVPASAAYEEIIRKFINSRTVQEYCTFRKLEVLSDIIKILQKETGESVKGLEKLTNQQVAGYYLINMLLNNCNTISEHDFDSLIFNDLWKKCLDKIPTSVKFDDAGEKTIRFKSKEQLEAFIVYWGILSKKPLDFTVKAHLMKESVTGKAQFDRSQYQQDFGDEYDEPPEAENKE